MNKLITGITVTADFCSALYLEEIEYSAFTEDGQLTLGGTMFGEDVDGNRGIYQIEIDCADVDEDSIEIRDDNGIVKNPSKKMLREARAALVDKLYHYDYRGEL